MSALDISPEEFHSLATRVTGLATRFLAALPALPSYPGVSGRQSRERFAEPLPRSGLKEAALDSLEDVLAMIRPPSPRFYGYVLGSGEPVAALGDFLASVLNQNVTAWRSSPAAVAIEKDVAAGGKPIAVVATAGTVNTGAIDPLEPIAAVCRKHDLWLHIDGAYGALAALASPERFRGLAEADSLSLDPHKWLYQPVDCSALLYRSAAAARAAFSQTGEYARTFGSDPIQTFAFFEESMELSRRFRALKLWLSLRYHGVEAFRAAIRCDLRHAADLTRIIRETADLELLAPAELSAVCFRYRAAVPDSELDRVNAAILKRLVERGRVYLSNASIAGHFALRACFVNHRTTDSDVSEIVPEVLAASRDVRARARRRRTSR